MPRFATFALLIVMPLMMNGCRNSLENLPENPLLTIYDTPHGVPSTTYPHLRRGCRRRTLP